MQIRHQFKRHWRFLHHRIHRQTLILPSKVVVEPDFR